MKESANRIRDGPTRKIQFCTPRTTPERKERNKLRRIVKIAQSTQLCLSDSEDNNVTMEKEEKITSTTIEETDDGYKETRCYANLSCTTYGIIGTSVENTVACGECKGVAHIDCMKTPAKNRQICTGCIHIYQLKIVARKKHATAIQVKQWYYQNYFTKTVVTLFIWFVAPKY